MEFTSSLFGDIAVDFNPGLGFDMTDPDFRSHLHCSVADDGNSSHQVLIEPQNIASALDIISTSFTTPIVRLNLSQPEYIFQDEDNSAALQRLLAQNVCPVDHVILKFDEWDEIPYNVDLLTRTLRGNTIIRRARFIWIKPDAAAAAMLAICHGPVIEEVEMRVSGASFGKAYLALFSRLRTQIFGQCSRLSELRICITKQPRFDWEFDSHLEATEVFDVIRRMNPMRILQYACWEWPSQFTPPRRFVILRHDTQNALEDSHERDPNSWTTSFRENVLLFTALTAIQRRTSPEHMRPGFHQVIDVFSMMAHQNVCDSVRGIQRCITGTRSKHAISDSSVGKTTDAVT